MDRDRVRDLLARVRGGEMTVEEAMGALRMLPFEDLGFAVTDSHRSLRTGYPEVVYCTGKTIPQIRAILARLAAGHRTIIASRATEEIYDAVREAVPGARYNPDARIIVVGEMPEPATDKTVLVISAGTSDIPVAEEAAVTAESMGNPVRRVFDVGVAGIHRLFEHAPLLVGANVIVAVAGMDGALPSVIGGLVDRPVIAVPTSVGYGASFGGIGALLTMLNSCAPGVAVVNIDNGFGAGYLAGMINRGDV